jgi:hypothetical protein
MARGKASGYRLSGKDVPLIVGMIARGDRDHDIAAWFGVNQARIAEAKDGQFGPPSTSPGLQLPPKGPPGIKGRKLRDAVEAAINAINSGKDPRPILEAGRNSYDQDES